MTGTRRLILLRHAKSDWPDVPDRDRPLAKRGRRDAPKIGRWLREHGYLPDTVICSTRAAPGRPGTGWRGTGRLPVGDLRAASLRGQRDDAALPGHGAAAMSRTALLIGHNPGIGAGHQPGPAAGRRRRADQVPHRRRGRARLPRRLGRPSARPGRLTDFTTPADL